MHVHLLGVSGTGMGSLAVLLREQGHDVSGSDVAFDPPIGPALEAAGVRCLKGWDASHLEPRPDLVVVGNVIRKDNVEAVAAEKLGLARVSMSRALRERFLEGRRPLVVAGTHGKTTTASMCAHVLRACERDPGWFIGGIPRDLPAGAAIGNAKRRLTATGAERGPFVVEGDEYDDVYWSKRPKFLDYVGVGPDDVAILTSVEQDHVDVYATLDAYERAFRDFVRAIPEGGLLVVDARDARARAIAKEEARARVSFYALEGDDTGDVTPSWLGAIAGDQVATPQGDASKLTQFDLFAGGVACGRFALRVPGAHNARNAIAAIAACAEGFGVDVRDAKGALARFEGVKRRQELLGEPGGVRVYDDFAHHPTAVDETLRALRARHPQGALWAIFEPRSATACRALHQDAYARAFSAADRVHPRAARAREHRGERAARLARARARARREGARRRRRRRNRAGRRERGARRRHGGRAVERRVRRAARAPARRARVAGHAVNVATVEGREAALAIAVDAAREAAKFVATGWRTHPHVEHKGRVDLVTEFDRASEAMLRARLENETPFPMVGEESGGARAAGDDAPTWFVDPLDGTTNFVHGHPFYLRLNRPLRGGRAAPRRGRRAGAPRSSGPAWSAARAVRSGAPCAVSGVTQFSDALLATGFPYDRATSDDNNFDAFIAIKRKCQAVRRCGSAAIDLCFVADGTYDGYWEKKLAPWDCAAGAAIVVAAGGRISDYAGGPADLLSGRCSRRTAQSTRRSSTSCCACRARGFRRRRGSSGSQFHADSSRLRRSE